MSPARYWSSACPKCLQKSKCTTGRNRRYAGSSLDQRPDAARERRQTVEHPFATLKAWMGVRHFLTKTLQKVRTEISLHVLAYNMKRSLKIIAAAG